MSPRPRLPWVWPWLLVGKRLGRISQTLPSSFTGDPTTKHSCPSLPTRPRQVRGAHLAERGIPSLAPENDSWDQGVGLPTRVGAETQHVASRADGTLAGRGSQGARAL